MREKGKSLVGVFNEIDKTGDGIIERAELRVGLEMLTKASDVSKFALAAELKRKEEEKAEEEKRQREVKAFFDRMVKAKEEGITAVLDKISGVMRMRQLRTKDLLSLKKVGSKGKFGKGKKKKGKKEKEAEEEEKAEGGGGNELDVITSADLQNICCRLDRKLDLTIEECDLVCKYIDDEGDGKMELDELQGCINDYRRYIWEKEQVVKHERFLELQAAPPMYTFREANLTAKSLDAVGGMDGMVSIGDIEEGIKRARGEGEKMEEVLEGLVGAGAKVVKVEKPVLQELLDEAADEDEKRVLQELLDEAAEEGEEGRRTRSSSIASIDMTVDAVSVMVPPESTSVDFIDRYKMLVLEPSQVESKKEVVYSEPKHIAGELLMLRFAKDAGGLEIDGMGENAGEPKTGFFSPQKLKESGYGDLEEASGLELVEICKRIAKGIKVEHSGFFLQQLS